MKQALKRALERLPGALPLRAIDALQAIRHPHVRARNRVLRRVARRLGRPPEVAQGPFRGMRYVSLSFGSTYLPKLLGTYERELGPAVEALCRAGPDRIIDVGTAEGYYAVGLALRNPDSEVVGFESRRAARSLVRALARRNGLRGRIGLRGHCTPEKLRAALDGAQRPAIVCDCEGEEVELLRPDRVPDLARALILVEVHDNMVAGVPDVGRWLADRLGATHAIEVIDSRARSCEDLPPGLALSAVEADEAMSEQRAYARWLFLTPREPAP